MLTIDIGDKHTALCFKSKKQEEFNIYLFSVVESDINEKMKLIRQHLDNIFDICGKHVKTVIIEKQMNYASKNIRSEFAVIMYLSILSEKYGFNIVEQNPQSKYKILGKHKGQNLKTLASQYVAEHFIDPGFVSIDYQAEFGKDGCRRRKDGSVRKCRWYTKETYNFCVDNDLDKLDDVADVILMQLFASNKNGNNKSK